MTSRWLITDWLILLLATLLATAPVLADRLHHPRMLIAQRGHVDNGGISLALAQCTTRKQTVIRPDDDRLGEFKFYTQSLPKQGKGKTWAHLVICDGRLYIRHGDFLYVYDIRAEAKP